MQHAVLQEMVDDSTHVGIKNMAHDTIEGALFDLRDMGRYPLNTDVINIGKNTIEWFDKKSTEPFGYGWCLEISCLNPNTIRRIINRLVKQYRESKVNQPKNQYSITKDMANDLKKSKGQKVKVTASMRHPYGSTGGVILGVDKVNDLYGLKIKTKQKIIHIFDTRDFKIMS